VIREIGPWVVVFACVVVENIAEAGIVVPPDLHPGDRYYLAFLTHDSYDATSADIAVYNQIVQNEAARNPALTGTNQGVQWRALASTPTVNAIDNLGLIAGVPVYALQRAYDVFQPWATLDASSLLATGKLNHYFGFDQFASLDVNEAVWTGTLPGGISAGIYSLGGASGTPVSADPVPEPFDQPFRWLDLGHSPAVAAPNIGFGLYAVSTLLVAPEPSTWCLLLIGSCGLLLGARRRR